MTQNYSQAYGYKFYFAPLLSVHIDLTQLDLGGLGAGKFMDNSSLISNSAKIAKTGTGSTFQITATAPATQGQAPAASLTVTKAAVTSNVATLTFAAATGYTAGGTITVSGLASPFAALNGTHVVTTASTASPYTVTFPFTGADIPEAAVTGGNTAKAGTGTPLLLDGTGKPIRLLGLTNAAPAETETEETVITYDDEAKSFETSIATGKGFSWTLEGVTDHLDAGYQLMRICSKESVREKLMIKYCRVGPTGFNEATYGFGRFTGFNETPPAGGIVKWSTGIKAYGPYELDLA